MKLSGLQKLDQVFEPHELWLINKVFREIVDFELDTHTNSSEAILHFARRNGLSPLLYHSLQQNSETVPPILQNALHSDYLTSTFHTSRLINASNVVVNEVTKCGIAVMPLKGVFLAQFVYPDSALRQMSDIDLLFPYNDAETARQVILSLKNTSSHYNKRLKHESDHDLHSIVYDHFLIEPHRLLLPSNLRYTIPVEEIWKQSSAIGTNNIIRQMNPTHLLLYLICHIHYTNMRGGIRAAWFYDLKAVLEHYKEQISHESIITTAKKWRILKPVNQTLTLCNWLIGEQSNVAISSFGIPKLAEAERIALLFRKSTQQQNAFSYRLAWERVVYTKGFTGKLNFIKSNLQLDNTSKNWWINLYRLIQRITLITYRTLIMIFINLLEKFRLRK